MQETTRGRQTRKRGQSSLQGSRDVGLRERRLVYKAAIGAGVGFIGKRKLD
jgi:hypothetical protein